MVKIRMTRLGRHKLPFYRIVVVDSRSKRDGGYIELLGTYEPFKGVVNINEESTLKFLREGAQPSDTVKSFLKNKGIWKKFMDEKVANKLNKKSTTSKKTTKNKKNTSVKSSFKKNDAKPKVNNNTKASVKKDQEKQKKENKQK